MHASRVYLVDGSSYVHRAFHAIPHLSSPSGMPTNAAYGFTNMLLKLLAEAHPTHVGVVFDAPGPTFRDEIYADYKATRPALSEDLAPQIPVIHEVVEKLGIAALCEPGVEADDVIATLATRFADRGWECVVVTGDKDLMQIVGPRVLLWDTMRDRWIDARAVEEKWGVPPERLADLFALVGDSSDNVPGVRGIGPKTAAELIRRFGSLEELLARTEEVERMPLRGAARIADRLRKEADAARTSLRLVRLRCDLPLDVRVEDLAVGSADVEGLRALFSRLGFQSLVRSLEVAPQGTATVRLRQVQRVADLPRPPRTQRGEWWSLVALAPAGPPVTTPAAEVVIAPAEGDPVRVGLDSKELRDALARVLVKADAGLVGYDLKRDLLHLEAAGLSPRGPLFDVMLAAHLLDSTRSPNVVDLIRDELGVETGGFRSDAGQTAQILVHLGRLRERLSVRLREDGLERLFAEVETPLLRILAEMERAGVLVDVDRLRKLAAEFERRLEALTVQIHELAGVPFNINSPAQLREILFERLRLPTRGVRRGKSGYSTDVDVLTRLAVDHPLPALVLEYRGLAKLKSTYVDALMAAVNPATGRLHTTFNQAVTATGRLSSSDPNLQNIPIRGEQGRRLREAFVAPPDALLVAADYSQIELRILAHMSGDPALIEAFRRGEDIHTRTAAEVFDLSPEQVGPEHRRAAKVINFGVIYGMGPQRLAHELGVSVEEAEGYIRQYFERYSGVRRYMQEIVAEGRRQGYVCTILGRRRRVPELRSADRRVAQAAERAAANAPIQGSAADVIKLAMVAVRRRLDAEHLRARLVLQVHDELLLEAHRADAAAVQRVVREEMEGALPLAVPLRVDVGCGPSWADAR